MAHYKMKFFGRVPGLKSGLRYNVKKDQIIEAPDGEFDKEYAEKIDIKSEAKETKEVSGQKIETASIKPKSRKRSK